MTNNYKYIGPVGRDDLVTIVDIWREDNRRGELEIDAFDLLRKLLDGKDEWYQEIMEWIDSLSTELKEEKEHSPNHVERVWQLINMCMIIMWYGHDPELEEGLKCIVQRLLGKSRKVKKIEIITNRTKPVDRYTRAGGGGRIIICPECDGIMVVYHFSWGIFLCVNCYGIFGKYSWKTPISPKEYKRQNSG